MSENVTVTDAPERHRYEAQIAGDQVGVAEYELDGSTVTFTHTVVDDSAEGKGVGSRLAKTALDAARDKGFRVVPQCRFIASYIARHEEYLDLVAAADRSLVDTAS
jgi:predicted GNAT family acetyltransferase